MLDCIDEPLQYNVRLLSDVASFFTSLWDIFAIIVWLYKNLSSLTKDVINDTPNVTVGSTNVLSLKYCSYFEGKIKYFVLPICISVIRVVPVPGFATTLVPPPPPLSFAHSVPASVFFNTWPAVPPVEGATTYEFSSNFCALFHHYDFVGHIQRH